MKNSNSWLALCAVLAMAVGGVSIRPACLAQSSSKQGPKTTPRPLSPEVQSYIKKLMEAAAAIPGGGDVRGFVEGKTGNVNILLHRARVFLERADNNSVIPQSSVDTDQTGHFRIPRQGPGTYLVCAEAQAYQAACADEKVQVSDHSAFLKLPITLKPVGGLMRGPLTGAVPSAPTGNSSLPPHFGTFIDPTRFMNCDPKNDPNCTFEAATYYRTIGVFDNNNQGTTAFGTLSNWKDTWGFSLNPNSPNPGELRAVYFNDADLKLGRDMHCLGPLPGPTNIIVWACYVTNFDDGHFESQNYTGNPATYGDPQPVIANAEASNSPIATVGMVWAQKTIAPFSHFVNFYVYNNKGNVDGPAATTAILDSEGPKAVPGLCIACHGGNYTNHVVVDGRFLPFDTPLFKFDTRPNAFTEAAQRETFNQMNQVVRATAEQGDSLTRDTIQNLIDGWYSWCGGLSNPSCYIDESAHPFIPSADCNQSSPPATCGWTNASLPNVSIDSASFYQKVPRQYCRTCHLAHARAFNWQNAAQSTSSIELFRLRGDVFTHNFMPFAEVPYKKFWNDDVSALDLLGEFVGLVDVRQLYYNNSSWSDQNLTNVASGPEPAAAAGISSFAISDGQHAYYVGSDVHIHQLYYNNSSWSDQDLTTIGKGPLPQIGSGISSFADAAGQHVYYVGSELHIHQLYYNNSSWVDQDLTSFGNGPLAQIGSGLSSFADSAGEHAYYVGSDFHLHQLYYNNSSWSDQDLTSFSNGPLVLPGFGVSSFADSAGEHVYYAALTAVPGHIHQLYFNNSSWIDQDLTALTMGATVALPSGISAFADSAGEHVYYIANESHMHQLYFNNSGWVDQDLTIFGNGPLAQIGSGISSFADSAGEHVYYIGNDSHVHQLYFNSGWSDQDLTKITNGPVAASAIGISSFASSDGEHVFYLGR